MELTNMANNIIKMVNLKFEKDVIKDCIDILQLINVCNLYKDNNGSNTSVSLNDIDFSSPKFKKMINKKSGNILESAEFKKKYIFLIKIIYTCLKMNINIFDINDSTLTFKNNYCLIKSIEIQKKNIILDHINELKVQHRRASHKIDLLEYETYNSDYIIKIKILDKIIESIQKIIKANVLNITDNLFALILPYFYIYTKYIEEYNK